MHFQTQSDNIFCCQIENKKTMILHFVIFWILHYFAVSFLPSKTTLIHYFFENVCLSVLTPPQPIHDLYILSIPYNPLRRWVVRYVHNIFLERFRHTFDTCSIQDDNVSSPILSHHLWFFVCRCSTHLEVSTFNKIINR